MKCKNCGDVIPVRKSLSTTKSQPLRKECPGCGEPTDGSTPKRLLFK